MGLRAGLETCRKSRPPPGFDPRTVQPVGSRYTDYATRSTCVLVSIVNLSVLVSHCRSFVSSYQIVSFFVSGKRKRDRR